jgi:hypothetical protein
MPHEKIKDPGPQYKGHRSLLLYADNLLKSLVLVARFQKSLVHEVGIYSFQNLPADGNRTKDCQRIVDGEVRYTASVRDYHLIMENEILQVRGLHQDIVHSSSGEY